MHKRFCALRNDAPFHEEDRWKEKWKNKRRPSEVVMNFFFSLGHLQVGDPFRIQTNQSLFSTSFSHSACVERLQQMVQGIVGWGCSRELQPDSLGYFFFPPYSAISCSEAPRRAIEFGHQNVITGLAGGDSYHCASGMSMQLRNTYANITHKSEKGFNSKERVNIT